MKRRYTYILHLLAVAFAVLPSCQQEVFEIPSDVPEGYVKIHFTADVPVFTEVDTKAVDPDGGGMNDMTLFCYDTYGLFLSAIKAEIDNPVNTTEEISGKFSANVPAHTAIIHFVGNQVITPEQQTNFYNKTEGATLETLEGSSGRMVYWGRKVFQTGTNAPSLDAQLGGTHVMLIRNHAKITVALGEGYDGFVIEGMEVYNSYIHGTICPWHPEKGFDMTSWPDIGVGDFVNIPRDHSKETFVTETTSATSRYVYEHDNTLDDPISVIIKGRPKDSDKSLYYRVMLMDNDTGENLLIRRNHEYTVNIVGTLNYGKERFTEATTASATNNVWISISDEIKEVRDSKYSLAVEYTSRVLDESYTVSPGNRQVVLHYTLTSLNSTKLDEDKDRPSLRWQDNNEVAEYIQEDDHHFSVSADGLTGEGTITFTIKPMRDGFNSNEGTLVIQKGSLFRKVKLITIREMSLLPAWVSSEVYGGSSKDNIDGSFGEGTHVMAMFTIPEETPEELFPFNVLISCDLLDSRTIAGGTNFNDFSMSIIREGEEGYGADNGIGYKYVYEVTGPGTQRVYMKNTLYQKEGTETTLTIEAQHFTEVEKVIRFTEVQQTIKPDMRNYVQYANDEPVYYIFVPQKRNALVDFGFVLHNKVNGGNAITVDNDDEFLIYTESLDIISNEDIAADATLASECEYYELPEYIWGESVNGRMLAFRPKERAAADAEQSTSGASARIHNLKFRTNKAKSEEMVRLTSVPHADNIVHQGYSTFAGKSTFLNIENFKANTTKPTDWTDWKDYAGQTYCSVTFELSNYNPFSFAATVEVDGEMKGAAYYQTDEDGDFVYENGNKVVVPDNEGGFWLHDENTPETVTFMEWEYGPEKDVLVAFDVTSFVGTDWEHVNPFGEAFEIHIDAPMLRINTSELGNYNLDGNKLREYPENSGHFIYTVDETRAEEAKHGYANALRQESAPAAPLFDRPDGFSYLHPQAGERKVLPFVVKDFVSSGEINFSSDENAVVFHKKTFSITNKEHKFGLTYDGQNIKADAFVSFEMKSNNNRIGVITMREDGQAYLHLRKEYRYTWDETPVIIRYQPDITDASKVYTAEIPSISALFDKESEYYSETTNSWTVDLTLPPDSEDE